MYDELVKRLRNCATQAAPCKTCDLNMGDLSCSDTLMKQAADAIEELIGFVQEAEHDRDEYRERIDKANDAVERLQYYNVFWQEAAKMAHENEPKWIPVTERLPEEYTTILFVSGSGQVHVGYYDGEHKGFCDMTGFRYMCTHWMLAQEPPKESES